MTAATVEQVEQIPRGNLRVPRADFASVWATAARLNAAGSEVKGPDWYAGGVAATCQWLARAMYTPPWGPPRPPRTPATGTRQFAFEELIEREYLAAERLPERRPELLTSQPGWCEGIRATLRWAWRHDGPPPFDGDGRPTAWNPPANR
ncbi:hypothetical protein [Pseudonocardia sp. HH130629-09]|uniref:hypothetical protein n=1 Tax=Pseudonocardia sp. HH130629-09 TaxID=1641402 RepID=UPI0011AE86B6|nr:hypothetical protein [Pseudonocardia sp. HH130629-09]